MYNGHEERIPITQSYANACHTRGTERTRQGAFVETIGFVFEDTPWIAAQVWQQRPFASLSDLHTALCRVMYEATPVQQLALICAHPDLAGRATQQGSLGTSSASEQATAGLDRLTPDEIEQFTRYNTAYRQLAASAFRSSFACSENKRRVFWQ
ncbi:MAG: 2-oxo-4-hydroxy-4-carboxy-5-ureidoimidazoline decarboxylase, partial [Chloroflexaceae bacterium]|nr:2-oxo-4-hydroxy-4-carboxy-5-ureidoimidazoline decarboxylase [Chloroflexaceae bacterium]